jgi:hypothetical protein
MMMSEEDAEQCYYNESIAFFYNRSMKPLAREWDAVSKLVMGLGITVCVFIMLANLLVMVAIYVNRRFHFPIYYLMANLAAAMPVAYLEPSLNEFNAFTVYTTKTPRERSSQCSSASREYNRF